MPCSLPTRAAIGTSGARSAVRWQQLHPDADPRRATSRGSGRQGPLRCGRGRPLLDAAARGGEWVVKPIWSERAHRFHPSLSQ
jgi:hypothetical protein